MSGQEMSVGDCLTCGLHYRAGTGHDDCKGEKSRPFHLATYYTCDDTCELLTYETYIEAIEEHVDGWFDPSPPPNRPIDEIIADIAPLKVYGWTRKVLPTSFGFGEAAIDSMLEDFEEMYWCDEYGNAFEEGSPPWDDEALKVVKNKLYATMQECIELANIWQCEQTSEMEFGVEELTAILKEHCPHWWEKSDA